MEKWSKRYRAILYTRRCTYLLPKRKRYTPGGILTYKNPLEPVEAFSSMRGILESQALPLRDAFPLELVDGFPEEKRFHVVRMPTGILRAEEDIEIPWSATDDAVQVSEYWDEVVALTNSPAGKKATTLLKEFLNEHQRKELDEKGYFFHTFSKWDLTRKPGDKHEIYTEVRSQGLWAFGIDCGGVLGTWFWDDPENEPPLGFCWHPEEPVPAADIALAHLLFIENNGAAAMLRRANW